VRGLDALSQALARHPDPAEIIGRDGRILAVNAAFERATGFTAEEVIGNVPAVLRDDHPEGAFHKAIAQRLLTEGQPWVGTVHTRHKDGSGLVQQMTCTPLLEDGTPAAILVLRRNVRPLGTPDPAIDEAESLYRHFFEHNPAIKLLIDPISGRIDDANAPAAAFYGYPRERLVGMSIHELNTLPPEEVRAEMERARAEERTLFRFPHRLAGGEVRRVEVNSGPVVVRGRTQLLSIIHDVTEREEALTELSASRARLRGLLDLLPVGLSVERDGAFVYVNEALARMLGYQLAALLGRRALDTVAEQDRTAAAARRDALLRDGQPGLLARQTMLKQDGSSLGVELRSTHFSFGEAPAILTVYADTTERDRLEEQLSRAQRMESLGRLAGGVAHDFNNLLFVIVNAARYVEKHLPQADPLRVHAERIQEASDRAAAVTRQLLLFSRGGDVRTDVIDADAVIRDTVRLLTTSLGENVQIATVLAGGRVRLARTSLEQILINLAVNARAAMVDGGILRITTAVDALDAIATGPLGITPGRWVRIDVTDTGPGMTDEVASHVFEPFFTTKDAGQGTGLGLAITYGIVQRAGGTVQLETRPGFGARFTIYLPAEGPTEPPISPVAQSRPPRSGVGETILVVEDDPAVREVVTALLGEAGYRVLSAPGPGDALLLADRHPGPIDLVLSDVMMPRMSGPEMVERLLALRPHIRVLFMSGYPGDALERAKLPEYAELLSKPFTEELLLETVRAKLDRAR